MPNPAECYYRDGFRSNESFRGSVAVGGRGEAHGFQVRGIRLPVINPTRKCGVETLRKAAQSGIVPLKLHCGQCGADFERTITRSTTE